MKNIHFIAIGGSAMHSLAIEMSKKGYKVTGSDDAIFEPAKNNLKMAGLLPERMGWFPQKISKKIDLVVLGMHAKMNNIELLKAQSLFIIIQSYPEFITNISKNKTRVVIAGSHGKTSITTMILHVLNYHNKTENFIIGAPIQGTSETISLDDRNDFFLIEGDEYLSSAIDLRSKFLWYSPQIALISGISWDHVNVFPTLESYKIQFKEFIKTITEGGVLIYNSQDKELFNIIKESTHPIKKIPYALPRYDIEQGVTYIESPQGKLPLSIFGEHNLLNIQGAKWISQLMGIDETDFFEAIQSFKGATGRLELIAKGNTSFLFKDFAHSPSKVKATTNAIASQFRTYRIIYCLELHTYSSLDESFIKNYSGTLGDSEKVIIFYDLETLKIKKKSIISTNVIRSSFNNDSIEIITDSKKLFNNITQCDLSNTVILMMSSGGFGGFNFEELKTYVKNF
jgi:UDP-N-acetylmuramate: L-alanyl-gamma-D-glutamyl-meso-diaminopimelate ligase